MHAIDQEERHVAQHVADGDRFDEGCRDGFRFVGNEDSVLPLRKLEIFLDDLVPNGLVDSGGIARGRREKINDDDVN